MTDRAEAALVHLGNIVESDRQYKRALDNAYDSLVNAAKKLGDDQRSRNFFDRFGATRFFPYDDQNSNGYGIGYALKEGKVIIIVDDKEVPSKDLFSILFHQNCRKYLSSVSERQDFLEKICEDGIFKAIENYNLR